MRKIIIGDIHGCFDETQVLLDRIKFNEKKDTLICLGDLMDRGPKSWEVLKCFMSLRKVMGDRLVLIRGNHDDMCIENREWWKWNGRKETYKSFNEHNEDPLDCVKWLKCNTTIVEEFPEFNVVHGGCVGDWRSNNEFDLMWNREAFEFDAYDGKLFFIGHTPVSTPTLSVFGKKKVAFEYNKKYSLPETGLLNIDTGCAYGYWLTACVIEKNKMIFYKNQD